MKLSLKLLLLLPFVFLLVGCPNDDATPEVVIRPYSEVAAEDDLELNTFMDEHSIAIDADYNVTFTEITSATPGTPISSHPNLTFKTVSQGGVDHKLYYISFRNGDGNTLADSDITNDNPTKLDSIHSVYKGIKFDRKETTTSGVFSTTQTVFDAASNPVWFQLENVIEGWQEIFPEFKRGNSTYSASTGITTYSDFGAGVMFVPSGLAYFNQSAGSIGIYTPIIFSFKLMNLKYKDFDGDKLLSKDEYGGPTSGTARDSDSDGKPDYADFDDDNDGLLTKNEIKKPVITVGVHPGWYAFDASELNCALGNAKKRYLNPNTGCN